MLTHLYVPDSYADSPGHVTTAVCEVADTTGLSDRMHDTSTQHRVHKRRLLGTWRVHQPMVDQLLRWRADPPEN